MSKQLYWFIAVKNIENPEAMLLVNKTSKELVGTVYGAEIPIGILLVEEKDLI